MLTELVISNVAVISHAEIMLYDGFNVFTGETGAGKSLIIDSINMLLGERGQKELIRFGEKKAGAEALFTVSDEVKKLAEEIIGEFVGNEITISRELYEDGRNVCRINGALSTVSGLKQIAPLLINIHGQHDGQKLLDRSSHIVYIDSLAKNRELLEEYREAFEKRKKLASELQELRDSKSESLKKLDLLKFWVEEIDAADLKPGEEEELTARRDIMRNSETLRSGAAEAYSALYGGENTAYELLSSAAARLGDCVLFDNALEGISSELSEALYGVEDAARELSSYLEGLDFDPAELAETEERLDLIRKLLTKYGSTVEEVLKYADDAREEIDKIEFSDVHEQKLEEDIKKANEKVYKLAGKISDRRKKAAEKLCAGVLKTLKELDMGNVRFEAKCEKTELTATGADKIEFLVATSSSQPLKPLQNIASGGEMSRICLAIKTVLSDADKVPTLIFDEIDTGVSGRAAQKIGDKMKSLGKEKQVISITHLPQIAAAAKHHYLIEKKLRGKDFETNVKLLGRDGRTEEIARIISGDSITDSARAAADEMLKSEEQ